MVPLPNASSIEVTLPPSYQRRALRCNTIHSRAFPTLRREMKRLTQGAGSACCTTRRQCDSRSCRAVPNDPMFAADLKAVFGREVR